MNEKAILSILLLAPLIGFLINGFRFKSKDYKTAGIIGSGASIISFICSLLLVGKLIGLEETKRVIEVSYFSWITVGNFNADAAFVIDQISSVMILVITGTFNDETVKPLINQYFLTENKGFIPERKIYGLLQDSWC